MEKEILQGRHFWLECFWVLIGSGDNIFGPSATDAAESLFRAFAPAMESMIPWAAILGNHDQESSMNREELMSLVSLMDYSVSHVNPPSAGGTMRIEGFGNYHIKVHGAPGSGLDNTSILNLYFLDSGDRVVVSGRKTYGWIRESQLNWVHSISQQSQVFLDPVEKCLSTWIIISEFI